MSYVSQFCKMSSFIGGGSKCTLILLFYIYLHTIPTMQKTEQKKA